jgi:TrmH family RNA methyltransferase
MRNLPVIDSPANPRMRGVVKLRDQRQRRKTGLFIAEGMREVQRALEAGLVLREGFVCPALVRPHEREPVGQLSASGRDWFSIGERLMGTVAYRENPACVLAIFEQRLWTLEQFEKIPAAEGRSDLWLVAVGTTKPGNLGAMARSAAAAGTRGLIVAEGVVDPVNPNAIRASTGAVFGLPIAAATSDAVLRFLSGRGTRIFAAVPHASTPYTAADMTGPTAVVVGAEDSGLGPPWTEDAEQVRSVAIPMHHRCVDSLNTSAAAAIVLFEAARQRRAVGS